MRIRIPILALACLLSACEVGPDYERPPVDTPVAFKESGDWQLAQPADAIDRGAWWSAYHDTLLDGLEEQVEVSNQNLKAAEAAYRQSTAISDETRATLFPSLSLSGNGTRSGSFKTGNTPVNLYNSSANASWAPDVWGRIRRSLETDEANAEASAADLASARLSAQASLATDYFDLRMQDELRRLLMATVEADTRALKIVQNQYDAGVAAKADVLAAQTQMESVEAQSINANITRAQLEHAIAVLIGKPPAEFSLEPVKQLNRLPNVPAEAPSTLLQRRPDIASAERAMESANAGIGVQTAAWYPNLTLSGSVGYSGMVLSKLLQASNSLWTVGPEIAETIFDAGARQAAVDQARAVYDQSVANYRQTVLSAFQQVEDDLVSLRVLEEQSKVEGIAVLDARKSEELTLNQYKEGIVPYSSVLTAQTTTLSNEQTALAVEKSRFDSSVALIQALGGGWDVSQIPDDAAKAKKAADEPSEASPQPSEPLPMDTTTNINRGQR